MKLNSIIKRVKTSAVLVLLMAFTITFTQAQETEEVSTTVGQGLCDCLNKAENLDDKAFSACYDEQIDAIIKVSSSQEEAEAHLAKINVWLGENCYTFVNYFMKDEASSYKLLKEEPAQELSAKACKKALKNRSFYYVDPGSDTVMISTEKGLWLEDYSDGAKTKLEMKWVGDCRFDLIMVESNAAKAASSKPGDEFKYNVIRSQKNPDRLIVTNSPGTIVYEITLTFTDQ